MKKVLRHAPGARVKGVEKKGEAKGNNTKREVNRNCTAAKAKGTKQEVSGKGKQTPALGYPEKQVKAGKTKAQAKDKEHIKEEKKAREATKQTSYSPMMTTKMKHMKAKREEPRMNQMN